MNMKKKELKWAMEEYPYPLNKVRQANFGIVEDDSCRFPVCQLPCSTSDKQSDALLIKQKRYALLIAAAPDLLKAVQDSVEIMGNLTDSNFKKHYSKIAIQFDENLKVLKKALGE